MFENVDGRTDDGWMDGGTTYAGVIGILIAPLGAFGSGELNIQKWCISRSSKAVHNIKLPLT